MATDVLLVKDGNRLAAADPISAETLEGMKQGDIVMASVKHLRNGAFHRKFFALISAAFSSQSMFPTTMTMLEAVKVKIGLFSVLPVIPGLLVHKPKWLSVLSKKAVDELYDYLLAKVLEEAKKEGAVLVSVRTRSISFEKMGESEFRQVYEKTVEYIVTEVLPGVDSDDLERQVLELIG